MMNKRLIHPVTLFFFLTLMVALFSWIGSVYGWPETHSLLNAEGMRWLLRNAVPNFLAVPWLGQLIVLSFGISICIHSGWSRSTLRLLFHRHSLSKKQLQAWKASVVVGILWLGTCLFMVFDPWGNLLSITGQWEGSPLYDGQSILWTIGFGLIGVVYGYAIDFYRNGADIIAGVSYLSACFPSCLITLFFLSLFFCSFCYTGLYHCLNLPDAILGGTYRVLVLLSLFLTILKNNI